VTGKERGVMEGGGSKVAWSEVRRGGRKSVVKPGGGEENIWHTWGKSE